MDARPAARFASLDGLRCLAIVPVVWHHATPSPSEGVLGRGPLGVDLFFAISGFLITTLLAREVGRRGTIDIKAFFARRALRIFPLYYAVLALYTLHAVFVREHGEVRDHFFATLPFYATYTSNWFTPQAAHPIAFSFAWSLATEEQFYLVWPFVLAVARRGLPAAFMIALIVIDQAAERGFIDPVLPRASLAARILRSLATPIGLGALLALAMGAKPRALALLGSRASAPLALAIVVACAVWGAPLLPTQVAMTALVGACVIREDNGLRWLMTWRPIVHVGVVSYGVYLVHVPITVAVRRFANDTFVVFVVTLAIAVGVATLTRRFVEIPFLRLGDRFRSA